MAYRVVGEGEGLKGHSQAAVEQVRSISPGSGFVGGHLVPEADRPKISLASLGGKQMKGRVFQEGPEAGVVSRHEQHGGQLQEDLSKSFWLNGINWKTHRL